MKTSDIGSREELLKLCEPQFGWWEDYIIDKLCKYISILLKMPSAIQKPRTLYDKVFQDHIVDERSDGTILLFIGRWHSWNEETSAS